MTDGAGAAAIGGSFGTGTDRGIALVFIVAGAIGLTVTVLAVGSSAYRQQSTTYADAAGQPATDESKTEPDHDATPTIAAASHSTGEPGTR